MQSASRATKRRMRTGQVVAFLVHAAPSTLVAWLFLTPILNAGSNDSVTITSEPAGARIEVNGRFIGTTPFEWKVGNWALNPHKSWATSKHLQESLVMTIIMEGFVPKTVEMTGKQLRWTSLNGQHSF